MDGILKANLPHGAITEIAERTRLSMHTISAVLSGKRKSTRAPEIFRTAAEIISERKAKENEARAALAAALDS